MNCIFNNVFTEITAISTPAYKTCGAISLYMRGRIKIKLLSLLKNSNGQLVLKSNCLIKKKKKLCAKEAHGIMGEMSRIIKKNDSVKYQQKKCIFSPTIFSSHFLPYF